MKAIILAAGIGKRIRSFTFNYPKCLLKVRGKSILERQVSILKKYVNDIMVVIGKNGPCWTEKNINEIRKLSKNLIVNTKNETTHSTFSLSLAMKKIKEDDVLIIDGDSVFKESLIKKMINSKHDTFVISKKMTNKDEAGSKIISKKDIVMNIGRFIKTDKKQTYYIYSGIMKIGKKHFKFFKKGSNLKIFENKEIAHLLKRFSEKNKLYNLVSEGWINVNIADDLKKAINM